MYFVKKAGYEMVNLFIQGKRNLALQAHSGQT
jgi:hypothetical protein